MYFSSILTHISLYKSWQQEIFSQSLKQQNHFLIAMWYVGNKRQYRSDLTLLWKIGNFIIKRLYTSLTWRLCIWHDPRLYDSQWRYYIASKFQCIFLTNGIQHPSSTIKIKHFFVNYRYSQNTLLPSLFSLHQTRRVFTTFLRICLVIIFTIITNCSLEIILCLMNRLLFIIAFRIGSQLLPRIDVASNGDVAIPIRCSRYVTYKLETDRQSYHVLRKV